MTTLNLNMNKKILNHYLKFSTYTYPGVFEEKLKNDLSNDVKKIGFLVRNNIIHRTTLAAGNTGTNKDLRFGDMTKVPWWRQPEDDIFSYRSRHAGRTLPKGRERLYQRSKRKR